MTEKRYYAHKHLLHENQVHDRRCHNFMNIDETVEHMNNEYWKYKELEEENEQLKQQIADNGVRIDFLSVENKHMYEVINENEQLKQQVEDLYESDKSLRKFASNMTLNYTGICVPRRLFVEVITILKDIEHNDLVEDLSKESIDTSANGC